MALEIYINGEIILSPLYFTFILESFFAYSFKNNTYDADLTDEKGYAYAENEFSVGLIYTDDSSADKNIVISYKVSETEITAFDDVWL